MQRYADDLCVKYVFLFDQTGKVVVTNSNYDHLRISNDPADPLYPFRVLLDGAASVTLSPMHDERYKEYIQYLGVSIRNEQNLCDGFVMIGVDPRLRDELLNPLSTETVLSNMVIGLPDYAIAIDKDTMKIAATTGLGYEGNSIEDLGISKDNLEANFSGFLNIDNTVYYAGVSESKDQYLAPIMRRTGSQEALSISLQLMLAAAATSLVIILLTLFRYQKSVIDSAPATEASKAGSNGKNGTVSKGRSRRLFSRFSKLVRPQSKRGYEERWRINAVPKEQQTPEMRISRIIYRLLLLFCLFVLLPTLYIGLESGDNAGELNNLAYVISGNWEKGINMFAFTSCIFLLCAMYVVSALLDRILYQIARISDMRGETVCLLIKNAGKYIYVVVFIYYGLAQFGVDTKTLLASAGILSLMFSLGAKDMVSDIIAGFFIIFEGTYKVGDFITVGSWHGTVAEIGLRTTKVQFFTDTKIFNNSSMRDIINSEDVARLVLHIPISYDADIPGVENILKEELPLLKEDAIPGLVKSPVYEGVSSFEDSSVMLQIVIYVESSCRFSALRALNREVKLIFDRRGIEIPFTQLVLHQAKDGE